MCHALAQIPTCTETAASDKHMGVVKKNGVGGVDSGDRLGC